MLVKTVYGDCINNTYNMPCLYLSSSNRDYSKIFDVSHAQCFLKKGKWLPCKTVTMKALKYVTFSVLEHHMYSVTVMKENTGRGRPRVGHRVPMNYSSTLFSDSSK